MIIDSKLSFVFKYFTHVDFIVLYYVEDLVLIFMEENQSELFENSILMSTADPHKALSVATYVGWNKASCKR